jgi:predicted ATPase
MYAWPEYDLWPLTDVTIVTMTTAAAWLFPTQSLRRVDTQVRLHVKFQLLLSDFNQKWNL